jgi:electron transport complex protein RnfG
MSWNLVPLRRRISLPETPRLVLTLAVAGLLSGLTIVSAYRLTLPRIQANQAEALRRAVFEVLPGAERMERLVWRPAGAGEAGGVLVPPGERGAAAGQGTAAAEPSVYAGYAAGGRFLGYAIPAAGAGFQDTISLLYGYDPAGDRIVGMQVLESRETPGLGDRIYKDEAFVAQFRDLAVAPRLELVKDAPTAPNQVDAITGATISSAAVVTILQTANDQWLERLEASPQPTPVDPGQEEPVPPARGGPIPGGKQ